MEDAIQYYGLRPFMSERIEDLRVFVGVRMMFVERIRGAGESFALV